MNTLWFALHLERDVQRIAPKYPPQPGRPEGDSSVGLEKVSVSLTFTMANDMSTGKRKIRRYFAGGTMGEIIF